MVGNFLTQILERPTGSNAPFNLLFINREKLVTNTATESSLPCGELSILRKDTYTNSTVRILNFRRWDFSLFKQLLIRFPKETIIRKKLRRAG